MGTVETGKFFVLFGYRHGTAEEQIIAHAKERDDLLTLVVEAADALSQAYIALTIRESVPALVRVSTEPNFTLN